jgi:alpha-D-ribose 1-methylphosphonate 5-triphosphate synthase subunit PhnI
VGYVAVKGGEQAIKAAREFARFLRVQGAADGTGQPPIGVEQIRDQLRLAVDRVMSEGSLYAPDYAALALKQAEGDPLEAAFILRAYRSSLPRSLRAEVVRTDEMRVIRRISAAFKDVPGGQILGPTRDYAIQLLDFALADEDGSAIADFVASYLKKDVAALPEVPRFGRVVDLLRDEGLLAPVPDRSTVERPFDITVDALTFPAPRSAKLQALARGETGGLMALAYSTMRGYGAIHPVVGELRVGYVPLRVAHPALEYPTFAGEIMVTEAQIVSQSFEDVSEKGGAQFTLGYGFCFGHNETKAISMAILDRATSVERPKAPGEDEEFVVMHTDGIEAAGFTAHWKLPHYVTFQSYLDRLRKARQQAAEAVPNG